MSINFYQLSKHVAFTKELICVFTKELILSNHQRQASPVEFR